MMKQPSQFLKIKLNPRNPDNQRLKLNPKAKREIKLKGLKNL